MTLTVVAGVVKFSPSVPFLISLSKGLTRAPKMRSTNGTKVQRMASKPNAVFNFKLVIAIYIKYERGVGEGDYMVTEGY